MGAPTRDEVSDVDDEEEAGVFSRWGKKLTSYFSRQVGYLDRDLSREITPDTDASHAPATAAGAPPTLLQLAQAKPQQCYVSDMHDAGC